MKTSAELINNFLEHYGALMGRPDFCISFEISDEDAKMLQKIHEKIRWVCGVPPGHPLSQKIILTRDKVQRILIRADQLACSTDSSQHALLLQNKDVDDLYFLRAILNGAINWQHTQETKIDKICKQFLTIARFIVAPYNEKETFTGFLASDQAQGLATGGEKPVALDQGDSLTCHEDLSACDETLKTTMANLTAGFLAIAKKERKVKGGTTTIDDIQLAYYSAVTGRSVYGGPPQRHLLTEGYTQPLAAFLAKYSLFIDFFLKKMELYKAMAVKFSDYEYTLAPQEMAVYFGRDDAHFRLLKRLLSQEWVASLAAASADEKDRTPKRKVYPFAQACQELLMELFRLEGGQSAFKKSCNDFLEVRDDKDDASLLDFFTKNVGIARYLQSKRGDLEVLASHLEVQRSRYKEDGTARPASDIFKPSPVRTKGVRTKRARDTGSTSAFSRVGAGEGGTSDGIGYSGAAARRVLPLFSDPLAPSVARVSPASVADVLGEDAPGAKGAPRAKRLKK